MAFGGLFGSLFGQGITTDNTHTVSYPSNPLAQPHHHHWPPFDPRSPMEQQFEAFMQEIAGSEDDAQTLEVVRAFAKKYMAKKMADALKAQQAETLTKDSLGSAIRQIKQMRGSYYPSVTKVTDNTA